MYAGVSIRVLAFRYPRYVSFLVFCLETFLHARDGVTAEPLTLTGEMGLLVRAVEPPDISDMLA